VVLLGGKEDVANAAFIQSALGNHCIDLCGKINLNQSAGVVKNSLQLFTNDTGLMHIAAALRVPTVSFWGNTVPAFGMSPYYGAQAVEHSYVENNNLSCRPCSKIGFQKCPKGHFNCMNQL
jgi:ADP-heptose:LPS heptosyltransferase